MCPPMRQVSNFPSRLLRCFNFGIMVLLPCTIFILAALLCFAGLIARLNVFLRFTDWNEFRKAPVEATASVIVGSHVDEAIKWRPLVFEKGNTTSVLPEGGAILNYGPDYERHTISLEALKCRLIERFWNDDVMSGDRI